MASRTRWEVSLDGVLLSAAQMIRYAAVKRESASSSRCRPATAGRHHRASARTPSPWRPRPSPRRHRSPPCRTRSPSCRTRSPPCRLRYPSTIPLPSPAHSMAWLATISSRQGPGRGPVGMSPMARHPRQAKCTLSSCMSTRTTEGVRP